MKVEFRVLDEKGLSTENRITVWFIQQSGGPVLISAAVKVGSIRAELQSTAAR